MAAADFTDVTGGECVGPGKQVLGLMPSRLRSRQPLDGECRLAMARADGPTGPQHELRLVYLEYSTRATSERGGGWALHRFHTQLSP